jgi:hypothetical protein
MKGEVQTGDDDLRKPAALGGQHRSDSRARKVVGDGMQGSSCRVNQGDLPGKRLVFTAPDKGTKNQPGRSQSIHSSVEAG